SLGVLLVTSAVVFTSHLNEIVRRDAGFERDHVLLFDLRPGELNYEGDRLRQFYYNLEERLAGLPGVAAVGLSKIRPMQGGGIRETITPVGETKGLGVAIHYGGPDFLKALGVPLIDGRTPTQQEVRTGAKVMVVGEDVVKQLGIANPIG